MSLYGYYENILLIWCQQKDAKKITVNSYSVLKLPLYVDSLILTIPLEACCKPVRLFSNRLAY